MSRRALNSNAGVLPTSTVDHRTTELHDIDRLCRDVVNGHRGKDREGQQAPAVGVITAGVKFEGVGVLGRPSPAGLPGRPSPRFRDEAVSRYFFTCQYGLVSALSGKEENHRQRGEK